ncbi:MAG: flagellar hook-length control protein FliK [Planctomycetes bacterium]|nr:flagellar hook-length control protein FliK [Planctomycetota bacterium]
MSQNVENVSLVSLVSLKGATSRGDADDVKAKNFSRKAIKNGGFDGFLQTFLGKDRKSAGSGSKSSGPGSGLGSDQKKAIRNSLGKTVPGSDDDISPEAAAAAREAADILWNLMYGPQAQWKGAALSGVGGASGNSLQYISSLIKQSGVPVYGTGASGINLAAMQEAIDTSNASAEMNNDATLAALDGLLDGLPQSALESALFQTARAMGYTGGGSSFLNQIAMALDAEVISVEHKPGGNLLSMLSSTGSMAVAAETAGGNAQSDGLTNLLNAFLRENGKDAAGESPIKILESLSLEARAQLLDGFAEFLTKPENIRQLKESGPSHQDIGSLFAKAARAADVPLDDELSSLFSEMTSRLESALHSSSTITATGNSDQRVAGKNSASDSGTSDSGGDNPTGGESAASQAGLAGGAGAAGTTGNDPGEAQTSLSTMLDQIDNIERLSEAMKMSRRNGGLTNLTMQLSPAELGRVMLRVESKKGVVSAHIRVEKKEALKELTATLSRLKENLEAQGIEVGELTIVQPGAGESLGDFSSGRQSGSFPDADSGPGGSGGERRSREEDVRAGPSPVGVDGSGSDGSGDDGGGLNVFV